MQTNQLIPRKPLRLWPGVVAALLLIAFKLVMPVLGIAGPPTMFLGGFAGGALIILWWVFLSRAPWIERLGAVVVMILAIAATLPFLDPSIAKAGQGRLFYILVVPVVALALVAAAVVSRRFGPGSRRAVIVLAIAAASGSFALLRTAGVTGGGDFDIHFRWTSTAEERLLAEVRDDPPPPTPKPAPVPTEAKIKAAEPTAAAPAPAAADAAKAASRDPITHTPAEWPGFRGPNRDNVIKRIRVETDWSQKPPVELWRRPVGPGWSSFAVNGDLIYTQEQRGEDEVVACYKTSTGQPVWTHSDKARFFESNAGAGPRSTPTLSNGRVYSFGATGILNVLDARNGSVVWTRNVATEVNKKIPFWGFSSSPLVIGDVVIVAAAGQLVAHETANGNRRWVGPAAGGSYSSPHLVTIDGVAQVLLTSEGRVTSVALADGKQLWQHEWAANSIVQPAMTADGNVLITSQEAGIRRISLTNNAGAWSVAERWTSNGLKPYFNDFVVHKGHAFGFDGRILSCVDLNDGQRKWKGGRYGNGQLVLLPDQDLLLVLSEEGELALVQAKSDQFTELAKFPAIQGKTWNHPVLVGDLLLVRNAEEMAAFRLPQETVNRAGR